MKDVHYQFVSLSQPAISLHCQMKPCSQHFTNIRFHSLSVSLQCRRQLSGLLELLSTYFPPHAHIIVVEGHTSKCSSICISSKHGLWGADWRTKCLALHIMNLCVFCTLIYAPELVSKVKSLLAMFYFSNHSIVPFSHDENVVSLVCCSHGSITDK